ncbi:MAG: hypothetical protein JKY37_17050 [Nannocystaceae bacterium]|nr:hypothetical protein [Nannocystaceae bacterium]
MKSSVSVWSVLGVALAWSAIVGASAGCGPSAVAGEHTVNPGLGSGTREVDPEGYDSGENIDTYRKQLETLREQRAEKTAVVEASFLVCEDLCTLMASICQVRAKLCALADEHPGEDNYQGLCREAQHECRETQNSCVACTQHSDERDVSSPAPAAD